MQGQIKAPSVSVRKRNWKLGFAPAGGSVTIRGTEGHNSSKTMRNLTLILLTALFALNPLETFAAEPEVKAGEEARFKAFEKLLTNAKLVGRFTILGRGDGTGREEEYTIESVKKVPNGDFWLFKARIKYGGTDVTLPMPLEVKWAGETPVITLTETRIPGLGTFSARVLIHGEQYAGIWKHGEYGGQMFGVVKRAAE
jgi:hypothetical protein